MGPPARHRGRALPTHGAGGVTAASVGPAGRGVSRSRDPLVEPLRLARLVRHWAEPSRGAGRCHLLRSSRRRHRSERSRARSNSCAPVAMTPQSRSDASPSRATRCAMLEEFGARHRQGAGGLGTTSTGARCRIRGRPPSSARRVGAAHLAAFSCVVAAEAVAVQRSAARRKTRKR